MKVALAQIAPTLTKNNETRHFDLIDAYRGETDIIIFPELSLSGYMLMDAVYELAYEPEELNRFCLASQGIDILLGCALREENKIFNAGVYFADGKIVHIHKKNCLPNYGMFEEARYFFEGETLEAFESKRGGKSVVAICEDIWNGKCNERLLAYRPDIIYIISNSPARGFTDRGLEIESQWESILKTLSILSGAYVIFVNRVGFEDGMGFWGGSCIIDPNGHRQLKAPLFEESFEMCTLDKRLSQTRKYLIRN